LGETYDGMRRRIQETVLQYQIMKSKTVHP
jgi:hypothetical protein